MPKSVEDAQRLLRFVEGNATLADKVWRKLREFKHIIKGNGGDVFTDEVTGIRLTYDELHRMEMIFEDALINADRSIYDGRGDSGDVKYRLRKGAEQDVEKALNNKNYTEDVYLTESSPSIITSQEGVKNLPMLMKASHIRENVFTEQEAKSKGLKVDKNINYHGLGKDLFLQIIDELENVTLAYRGTKNAENPYRRENYFLLISQCKDADGNKINVPIFINETGQYNRVFIDTNKIATVFGRKNFNEYIKREVQKKNLVRIKNRSTQASELTAPIADSYSKNASADMVSQKNSVVNSSILKNSKNDTGNTLNRLRVDNEDESGYNDIKNNPPAKIRYDQSGLKRISVGKERVISAISTDYHNKNKTHEGLQYQSVVTDKGHFLYLYEDGDFGQYNIVLEVDYANEEIATKFIEVINDGKVDTLTGIVNRVLKSEEARQSGYSCYNAWTKQRRSSRGNASVSSRLSRSNSGGVHPNSGGDGRDSGTVKGNPDGGTLNRIADDTDAVTYGRNIERDVERFINAPGKKLHQRITNEQLTGVREAYELFDAGKLDEGEARLRAVGNEIALNSKIRDTSKYDAITDEFVKIFTKHYQNGRSYRAINNDYLMYEG